MKPLFPRRLPWCVVLAVVLSAGGAWAAPVEFNRDVRPILSEKCFFCHGPDKNKRKAGLRLDVREAALADEAFVPGKPDASAIIERITTRDPDDVMPPPEAHKPVKPAELEVLRRWISEGAVYQPHWAYVPVRRPPVPVPKTRGWARNPIDAFVLARLDQAGLAPSRAADGRTLLRRLSLDLLGLPPSPEALAEIAVDTRTDAIDLAVERLLASPHFGERMAVPWLDVVRFADTVGYHGDQNQNIFPYRDYVIAAFNANKRFDAFTVEQLAGDLLPKPTTEQLVATGFNRLNMVTREGGAQPKEYLAKYMGDRVRAVGAAWLGSTIGCAECHDHKYDPITARDFYALGAFFADVKEWGVYHDYDYTPNPELKGWSNEHPFPPELTLKSAYLDRRAARLRGEITAAADAFARRLRADRDAAAAYRAWKREAARVLAKRRDGFGAVASAEADGKDPKKDASAAVTITPGAGTVASLRVEVEPTAGAQGFGSLRLKVTRAGKPVELGFADAAVKAPEFANGHELIGVARRWKVEWSRAREGLVAVYDLAAPLATAEGEALVVTVTGRGLGRAAVAASPFAAFGVRGRLAPAAALRSAGPELYLLSSDVAPEEAARLRALVAALRETRDGTARTLITVAREPRPIRVLPRGNWQDDSGPLVDPATPGFLPQHAEAGKRRLTRLDLARWLTSRENPLTARVFVNRLWKHLHGTGLSSVLDDVGAQGETPSHPELLDWLAAEFMESGWDVKHIVRLMVGSATYRQQSTVRAPLGEVDPSNRLLARQSQRRLDAEFVRDNALAVAGLLNLDLGGPSVFPYQPPGYYENLEFPQRDWIADRDDRQYRRGVYVHWQRTFLHPMMANFDAPSREECTADRPPSNTPQQALTLLNDPTFVEAARVLAGRLLDERIEGRDGDGQRLARAFERASGRPPTPQESASLIELLGAEREHWAANVEDARKLLRVGLHPPGNHDPAEHAAWTSVSRAILNLYDVVTRP